MEEKITVKELRPEMPDFNITQQLSPIDKNQACNWILVGFSIDRLVGWLHTLETKALSLSLRHRFVWVWLILPLL